MDNKRGLLLYALACLLAISLLVTIALMMGDKLKSCDGLSPVRDTTRVTYFDTLYYTQCTPKDSVVLRYVTVKVPVKVDGNTEQATKNTGQTVGNTGQSAWNTECMDTETAQNDSVYIDIPITQKTYSDSTYTAWVSGYDVTLDSIRVYRREEVVTITEKQPPKRWHLGLTAGYGLGTAGLQPYIGIGVTYSIISF